MGEVVGSWTIHAVEVRCDAGRMDDRSHVKLRDNSVNQSLSRVSGDVVHSHLVALVLSSIFVHIMSTPQGPVTRTVTKRHFKTCSSLCEFGIRVATENFRPHLAEDSHDISDSACQCV